MPKVDVDGLEWKVGSNYPPPFDALVKNNKLKALGDAGGLDQFGVNLQIVSPGNATSQRHYETTEDEFIYVLDGELTLIEETTRTTMRKGDAATFKAGIENGHHLLNESSAPATLLIVGTRAPSGECIYPDVDLHLIYDEHGYKRLHKDGTPYPTGD